MIHINIRLPLLVIFFLAIATLTTTQAQTTFMVSYQYDAAGNRTQRSSVEVIETKSAIMEPNTLGLNSDEILAQSKNSEKLESFDDDIKYTIYPNPTFGKVILNISPLPEHYSNAILSLYDLSGKLISEIHNVSALNVIDLQDKPAGNYIIQLSVNDKKLNWKILKK